MVAPVPSTEQDNSPLEPNRARGARAALFVASGIFLSRIVGLVRARVFAHYLGNSIPAAAFQAALRIPNFLQNLFGEGVLSGSFIPVYANLVGKGEREEADRVAGAVFGLLALVTSILVALGVLFTPLFIDLIAPGFEGESRDLTISLVRILFPGTGLLVLSAWCLGVLNSHRRFLLSYAAPIVWNGGLIAALLLGGGRVEAAELAIWVAWGAVAGSFLQLAIQVPTVLRLLGRFRPSLDVRRAPVRTVLHNFGPVVGGRGVVQISAYVDTALASLVSERALATLAYAQTIYLIPISLFGMAVSAAELPEMSQATGTPEEVAHKLRTRLELGSRRISFFVVPSVAALFFLGDVVGGALLQTGRFTAADTRYLWYLLMGASIGLLSATLARLYASCFYALQDARTPLRLAIIRVSASVAIALFLLFVLPLPASIPNEMRAVFLTAASGLGATLEYQLLRRRLARRIGPAGASVSQLARLWVAAATGGAFGLALKVALSTFLGEALLPEAEWGASMLPMPALSPILTALLVLGTFGLTYFAVTFALGVPESRALWNKVLRRAGSR